MPQRRRAASRETPIQSLILDYLTRKGVLCWRNQQIPVPLRRGGEIVGLRRADPFTKGLPDILVVLEGHLVGLEVKDKTKQSPDQIRWEKLLKQHGADYFIVHSLEEAIDALILCSKKLVRHTDPKSTVSKKK